MNKHSNFLYIIDLSDIFIHAVYVCFCFSWTFKPSSCVCSLPLWIKETFYFLHSFHLLSVCFKSLAGKRYVPAEDQIEFKIRSSIQYDANTSLQRALALCRDQTWRRVCFVMLWSKQSYITKSDKSDKRVTISVEAKLQHVSIHLAFCNFFQIGRVYFITMPTSLPPFIRFIRCHRLLFFKAQSF